MCCQQHVPSLYTCIHNLRGAKLAFYLELLDNDFVQNSLISANKDGEIYNPSDTTCIIPVTGDNLCRQCIASFRASPSS
jgi:hypothetical protein